MNPTIQFFKKQGLKVSLPLLLLSTACGEGTPSAQQADIQAPAASVLAAAQPTTTGFGAPVTASAPPAAAEVSIDTEPEPTTIADVLPPATTPDDTAADAVASSVMSAGEDATAVPEPTALAGLAITAAGLIVVKRKQAA